MPPCQHRPRIRDFSLLASRIHEPGCARGSPTFCSPSISMPGAFTCHSTAIPSRHHRRPLTSTALVGACIFEATHKPQCKGGLVGSIAAFPEFDFAVFCFVGPGWAWNVERPHPPAQLTSLLMWECTGGGPGPESTPTHHRQPAIHLRLSGLAHWPLAESLLPPPF